MNKSGPVDGQGEGNHALLMKMNAELASVLIQVEKSRLSSDACNICGRGFDGYDLYSVVVSHNRGSAHEECWQKEQES